MGDVTQDPVWKGRTKAEGRARKHSAPAGGRGGAERERGLQKNWERGQSVGGALGEESWRPGKGD